MNSILNPTLAEKYFPNKIFQLTTRIKITVCEKTVVKPGGIKPNPKKIEAIQKFPLPKTAKEIKSFLGFLRYYRRFTKNFSKIAKLFTRCLKKGEKIKHMPKFISNFEHCKKLFSSDPILQYPEFTKLFIITTVASQSAIGSVVNQGIIGSNLRIAYASGTLNPNEVNFITIEK